MERRAPVITILAISSLCALLGLFESAGGVLLITPFLLLVLPLLAGYNPAGPAVGKLLDLLGAGHSPEPGRPRPAVLTALHRFFSRIADRAIGSRGPPLPAAN